jgi:ATP-dependent 26S proteasome regulatory subunit
VQAVIERCITGTEGFGSLESVVGFQKPKEDIIASLVLPIEVPSAFSSGIRHNNMFLLYGLPGNNYTNL